MANPSKFNELVQNAILFLAGKGKTDQEMASVIGVSVRTFNVWKSKHPDFFVALKEAKLDADDLVELSLFQRACGYSHPETKVVFNKELGAHEEFTITKNYPPDTMAAIYWLNNRKPKDWKNRVEHVGEDGKPLVLAYALPEKKGAA